MRSGIQSGNFWVSKLFNLIVSLCNMTPLRQFQHVLALSLGNKGVFCTPLE